MKTLLLGLAISAVVVTGPAAAQNPDSRYQDRSGSYGDDDRGGRGNIPAGIEQLRERVQAGVQSGTISRQEAAPLWSGLRSLNQLERRYSRNGLSNEERRDLQTRLRSLRQDVRRADNGASGRYDAWDRDNGRYDDRDYDRDDRRDDDRDDRYREPQQRGGLGGVIDGVLGRSGASLKVGQRAPSDLYGVPYEYRDRYRDTDRSYYRSDGRQIYQIDTRTQAVIRIHAMN